MAVYFNGTQVSEMYFGGTIGWGGTGTLQSQTFTTSGTFTVPANVRQLYVICTGGGGGCYADEYSSKGFGSGRINAFLHVTPGSVHTVIVGAGGAYGSSGGQGGTTSFGALVSCTGGNMNASPAGQGIVSHSNYGDSFVQPSVLNIHPEVKYSTFTTNTNYSSSIGGCGGFGAGVMGAPPANSGAGGGVKGASPSYGAAGRCVVYWFTYS